MQEAYASWARSRDDGELLREIIGALGAEFIVEEHVRVRAKSLAEGIQSAKLATTERADIFVVLRAFEGALQAEQTFCYGLFSSTEASVRPADILDDCIGPCAVQLRGDIDLLAAQLSGQIKRGDFAQALEMFPRVCELESFLMRTAPLKGSLDKLLNVLAGVFDVLLRELADASAHPATLASKESTDSSAPLLGLFNGPIAQRINAFKSEHFAPATSSRHSLSRTASVFDLSILVPI